MGSLRADRYSEFVSAGTACRLWAKQESWHPVLHSRNVRQMSAIWNRGADPIPYGAEL